MKQYTVETVRLKNGEEIAYRKAGSGGLTPPQAAERSEGPPGQFAKQTRGRTVLLIHGNMSSSVHWQTTMEELEGNYTVIAPDLRGFGDSSYINRFDSLKELAEDVSEMLAKIGVGKHSVVGWSMGGGVALELAVLMPESVEKAVLVNSVPVTGFPMYRKDSSGHPVLTQPLTSKMDIALDPVQVAPILAAYEAGDREFMRMVWNGTIYNRNQPPAEDYEHYLDAIMKQRNLVDVDYSLVKFSMAGGRLAMIKCAVTVIQGTHDMVVPMTWSRQSFELLKQGVDDAKLITLDECGHSPITDNPGLFFQTLRDELPTSSSPSTEA